MGALKFAKLFENFCKIRIRFSGQEKIESGCGQTIQAYFFIS